MTECVDRAGRDRKLVVGGAEVRCWPTTTADRDLALPRGSVPPAWSGVLGATRGPRQWGDHAVTRAARALGIGQNWEEKGVEKTENELIINE